MGSRISLKAPWTTRSRIVGIDSARPPFPSSLGIVWCRNRMGRYVRVASSCRICSRNPVEPAGLDGFKRHPVDTWCAVVGLGQVIGFLEGFPFADVDIQALETPGRS